MNKKMLIITAISIFILCSLCTFSFATERSGVVGNVASDAAGVVENGGQMVGNAVENGGQMIGNAVEGGTDMIKDGANIVDDTMTGEGNMIENGVTTGSQALNDIGGDAKNATETMTTDGLLTGNNLSGQEFLGVNLSTWLWIIVIIIIIVVIVLICKYMQKHDDNEDDE